MADWRERLNQAAKIAGDVAKVTGKWSKVAAEKTVEGSKTAYAGYKDWRAKAAAEIEERRAEEARAKAAAEQKQREAYLAKERAKAYEYTHLPDGMPRSFGELSEHDARIVNFVVDYYKSPTNEVKAHFRWEAETATAVWDEIDAHIMVSDIPKDILPLFIMNDLMCHFDNKFIPDEKRQNNWKWNQRVLDYTSIIPATRHVHRNSYGNERSVMPLRGSERPLRAFPTPFGPYASPYPAKSA